MSGGRFADSRQMSVTSERRLRPWLCAHWCKRHAGRANGDVGMQIIVWALALVIGAAPASGAELSAAMQRAAYCSGVLKYHIEAFKPGEDAPDNVLMFAGAFTTQQQSLPRSAHPNSRRVMRKPICSRWLRRWRTARGRLWLASPTGSLTSYSNLTGGHQGRDIVQHLLVVVGGEVAHPEILYCHAPRFEERLAQLHQRRAARDAVLITIVGDEAANGHPGSMVQQWQHRLEHFASHVLEIDVDAGRAGGGEVRRQGR